MTYNPLAAFLFLTSRSMETAVELPRECKLQIVARARRAAEVFPSLRGETVVGHSDT